MFSMMGRLSLREEFPCRYKLLDVTCATSTGRVGAILQYSYQLVLLPHPLRITCSSEILRKNLELCHKTIYVFRQAPIMRY